MSFDAQLSRMLHGSRYAERCLHAEPSLRESLERDGGRPFTRADMEAHPALQTPASAEGLASGLRQLRRAVMLRTILRDLNGLATLDEVMTTVTDLAEVAIASALSFHQRSIDERHGRPLGGKSGKEPLPFWVVGMGKLGGAELNVSSDIDLIFVYPEDGETPGPQCISHHEYAARLGKRLIAALDEITAEGQVFRVDMRLRPFGDSGPLVASLDSLEHYFITSARPWERYAWLKARVMGTSDARALEDLVRPFVYRKYHDYGMIQDLRDLHANIRAEALRRNRLDDIKVGAGGIREVEFIAQLQQLIRGGRELRLQTRSTREALREEAALGLIDAELVSRLQDAYQFLRRLEHRLQYLDDAQTQALPRQEEDRSRIAAAMDFPDWSALMVVLDQHRRAVSGAFDALFASAPRETGSGLANSTWQDSVDAPEEVTQALLEGGYPADAAASLVQRLAQWRQSARFRFLTEKARAKLERLIPLTLTAATAEPNALETCQRLLELLEAIDRRDAYLSLLIENPAVLSRAARLASRSAWAAGLLRRHPILLDELVKNRNADARADWARERDWLRGEIGQAGADIERHYEILRHFKQIHTLRLNIADVDGNLDVMTLADELSALADLLLDTALALAWRDLRQKAGDSPLEAPPDFAVIGYGKLGSKELGYASDMDLVFVMDETGQLDSQTAYRLAQRLNQLLTANTTGGALYETDLRLRPDGAAGMLVTTLAAFRDYQLGRAWTWEHQALTRARFCAGDQRMAQRFEAIRGAILGQARDVAKLTSEVLAMRQKMRSEHSGRGPDGRLDLKHVEGGIVDLEFIVQYLVLRYSNRHASLTRNAGNFTLLALAGELGLINVQAAREAGQAYIAFRARQHLAGNNNESRTLIRPDELSAERDAVKSLWRSVFPSG